MIRIVIKILLLLILASQIQGQTADTLVQTVPDSSTSNTKPDTSSVVKNISPPDISEVISVSKIIWAVIFLLISFYIIRLTTSLLNKLSERSAEYRITLKGFIPVVRILGWTVALYIVIAGIFAPPVETVLLITGSLGIAVGFASQDIFKNIFGGLMILLDRPFQVGDKIQVGSHYGEVLSIGLRSIRVVTPDDSVVSIPNGELMNQSVSNSNTGAADCQVVSEMYLPVHIDTAKAKNIAIRAAQVSKFVYLKKPIAVIFKNEIFQDRPVLKMRLKAYVFDIRYEFAFMSDMTESTIRELIKAGAVSESEINGFNGQNNK
ncbi:MAG: potassium transporter KefA [Melioribacteraceae bacterium]|nr:MAG: potassium transporter KefA [Melioribacteraceae bacterium]